MLNITYTKCKTQHITQHNCYEYVRKKVRLYSESNDKVFLELCPVRKTDNPDVLWDYYDSLMVYRTDYSRLLVPYFDKLFPIIDPYDGEIQNYFDVCSVNWIGSDDLIKFVEMIEADLTQKAKDEQEFYHHIINFIRNSLSLCDVMAVEGNQ